MVRCNHIYHTITKIITTIILKRLLLIVVAGIAEVYIVAVADIVGVYIVLAVDIVLAWANINYNFCKDCLGF